MRADKVSSPLVGDANSKGAGRDYTGAFCALDHGGLVGQFPFEQHRLAHLGVHFCLFSMLRGLPVGSSALLDRRRECIPTRAGGTRCGSRVG